jgi:RNA polymerase sigma-70 factor (ECF subfamily)
VKSLEKIVVGCKKNKAWAQADLFAMFSDKMFGTCLYYSNNKADAEDLLHDGFLKVFENIKKYQSDNFEAWMRRVFVNLALMRFRKRKFETVVENVEPAFNAGETFEMNSEIHADELMVLITQLPPQYKMVFNLYAIEGYKHKEIAEMLEITEGTSKSNLSRARQILQKQLVDYNE